jgi:hypothetical protein
MPDAPVFPLQVPPYAGAMTGLTKRELIAIAVVQQMVDKTIIANLTKAQLKDHAKAISSDAFIIADAFVAVAGK